MRRREPIRFFTLAVAALPGCSLLGFFETPPQRCEAGDVRVEPCVDSFGHEGQRERRCTEEGTWSDWSECESDRCDPGQIESMECDPIEGAEARRSRTCGEDGTWSDWSDCELWEPCTPGAERSSEFACGPCSRGDLVERCEPPGHWVDHDCRDNELDLDGDGFAHEWCLIREDPGFPECCGEVDCDDDCPTCHPGAEEIPANDLDEDCSGVASDMDGDGILAPEEGGGDCHDRDPLRSSGRADLDGDGHDVEGCGDDCDDDCPSCHPGALPACGEARDHDCDGVIDELGQCDACTPGAPRVVALAPLGSPVETLFVSAGYAYLGDAGGLQVVDVSEPEGPEVVGSTTEVGCIESLIVRGDRVYLASCRGFHIADVSTPSDPVYLTDTVRSQYRTTEISLSGRYAYLAMDLTEHGGHPSFIDVYEISIPQRPLLVERYDGSLDLQGLFFARGALFATGEIVFTMDPADMTEWFGSWDLYGHPEEHFNDIFVAGELAYVAADDGFYVLDVTDPSAMDVVAQMRDEASWTSLFVAGGRAYVTGSLRLPGDLEPTEGLHIIDVSDPEAPVIEHSVPASRSWDVHVSGGRAYLAGEGLTVVDLACGG